MLYERKQLPELLYMKHRHDTDDNYIKYDERILDKQKYTWSGMTGYWMNRRMVAQR